MQTTALPDLHLNRKLDEIRAFCRANADPVIVKKYARYFKEGYDAYGLDPKVMDRQREKWLADWGAELGLDGFLALGDRLVASGKYEEAFIAIRFVATYAAEFTPKTLDRFAYWLDNGLCNWAHVDVFSGEVLSRFLTTNLSRDGDVASTLVPLETFAEWRKAESKWRRRSVPVTLISTLKAGYAVPKLLKFISPMMGDSERVVQQGLGWFLREAWKKDAEPVEKLLFEWKDKCGRLIVQYATEKMSVESKKKFKASKK
jgi:3-methyladenine DNA glycosylase AlkD